METYRCWCELCDFRKNVENLEDVLNITDQHRVEYGENHFVEFKAIEQEQLSNRQYRTRDPAIE